MVSNVSVNGQCQLLPLRHSRLDRYRQYHRVANRNMSYQSAIHDMLHNNICYFGIYLYNRLFVSYLSHDRCRHNRYRNQMYHILLPKLVIIKRRCRVALRCRLCFVWVRCWVVFCHILSILSVIGYLPYSVYRVSLCFSFARCLP